MVAMWQWPRQLPSRNNPITGHLGPVLSRTRKASLAGSYCAANVCVGGEDTRLGRQRSMARAHAQGCMFLFTPSADLQLNSRCPSDFAYL